MRQRVQTLQRQGQVGPALVGRDGMDLIHDDGPNIAQCLAALLRSQEQEKRFRRRDEDMRRAFEHPLPLPGRRVSRPDIDSDLRHQQASRQSRLGNFKKRLLKILLDVVAQRLQRRDVEHLRAIFQFAGQRLLQQAVNAGEKCRQRLSRARRRSDERVFSRHHRRPALDLDVRRPPKPFFKPFGNERVKLRKRHSRNCNTPFAFTRMTPHGTQAEPQWRARI